MQKQIPKPANWQDFESLCKLLWGEIWSYPEIKKNGRTGQPQCGVDVYGRSDGALIGIQCKGKDDAIGAILSKTEIDTEIAKAKNFKPQLKKLYFATTANKDVRIEEYIRIKDDENQSANSFEIHLFDWEDIADLLRMNKRCYEWHMNQQNYQVNFDINIGFEDGQHQMDIDIKREKYIHYLSHKPIPQPKLPAYFKTPSALGFLNSSTYKSLMRSVDFMQSLNENRINRSYINFCLRIENSGEVPISNYKIEIAFGGGIEELKFDKVYEKTMMDFNGRNFTINRPGNFTWQIVARANVLVPLDKEIYRSFSIRPSEEQGTLIMNYKLLSSEYTKEGKLEINYKTVNIVERKYYIIPAEEKERQEISYKDYFETENEDR
ncbi:hypothetical protein [Chryseobacterium sp. ERMR1:04]|uniref:restriction endonuclease n=1 Tax=Chryseobacterium sp. ERMR1:04 TaxID=1705393 RepID=UPI0006C847D1|nr:hypothetical protein [Chryseobacterium sp. ERMR1:04]KPH13391.1 hypothetical protein AMQ68_13190 [Chryseobacterium sp. ERMR1:04]